MPWRPPGRMLAAAGLGLALCPLFASASPPIRLSGSAGFGYDGNPANAEADNALPATGFASAQLDASFTRQFGDDRALLLRGTLEGQQYFADTGLSNAKAAGLARLLYRPGGGFLSPTLSLWGSAASWQFGSRMRSGAEYRAGAFALAQLTTTISLRAGGYASERRSTSSVFDLFGRAATLDFDWLLGERLSAYGGYEFRYGSFAESSPPDSGAARVAQVVQSDDALHTGGAAENTYRLLGHAQVGSLGLNYALSPRLALDAEAQNIHTRAAASGDHYIRWLARVGVLARF